MGETPEISWVFDRIASHGEKPFLASGGRVLTYRDLVHRCVALQNVISNIPKGASVGLLGDYSLDSIAMLLSLLRNENIITPISPGAEQETGERMREAFCSHLIDCRQSDAPKVELLALGDGEHLLLDRLRSQHRAGLVLFSSGSSGKAKAMVHDLHNLVNTYAGRKPRNLTLIVFLMFDHIGGVNTLFNSLATGSFMVAPETREASEVADLIRRHRVAILPTSPTFLNLLLIAGAPQRYDLSSLKIITYGTEPMPESLLARLREAFPKVRFLQTFGTSETGISRTESKASASLFMKLDDPDIEHKIVNGELWLRSKTQILGYLNHSMEAFTEDGWFRTGDQVEVDAEGYLRIVGRATEIINVGGEKVYPSEVESVVMELPEVADCIVRGETSPITGQIVAATVSLAPDTDQAAAKAAIRRHCGARLARYKIPVKIRIADGQLFGGRFKKSRSLSAPTVPPTLPKSDDNPPTDP